MRGIVTTMEYDLLGQLTARITPEVRYAQWSCTWCILTTYDASVSDPTGPKRFPYYKTRKNDGSYDADVVFRADTARFTYDAVGRLLTANNYDAKVKRTYFSGGELKTDTLRIGVYDRYEVNDADPFTRHVYGLTYAYDKNGRVTSRIDNYASCSGCVQSFAYHSVIGNLSQTVDAGSTFTFGYDDAGRYISQTTPASGIGEARFYDQQHRLTKRTRAGGVFADSLVLDARGNIVQALITSSVSGLGETSGFSYNGLGALVAVERTRADYAVDEFAVDAHGDILKHSRNAGTSANSDGTVRDYSGDRLGLIAGLPFPTGVKDPSGDPVDKMLDTTYAVSDASGNDSLQVSIMWKWYQSGSGVDSLGIWHAEPTDGTSWARSFYGADEKLRVFQRTGWETAPSGSTAELRTTFSEYFYDALGRRIMIRTRRDSSCTSGYLEPYCVQPMERVVWDGDRVLAEHRTTGSFSTGAFGLENEIGSGQFLGSVRFAHAPGVTGIDHPVGFYKDGVGLIPHLSWRGGFEAGIYFNGSSTGSMVWPARYRDLHFAPDSRVTTPGPTHWLGSLIEGKVDASGLVYHRNRYYDPRAGRFTQEDPIGLAGGMNLYGFAGGDPINHSDPFGLCPEEKRDSKGQCPGGLSVRQWGQVEYAANNHLTPEARDRVLGLLAGGKIHAENMDVGANAATEPNRHVFINTNSRNGNMFEVSAWFFATTLAHESEHVEQFKGVGGLFNAIGLWLGSKSLRDRNERAAYAYGCANSKSVEAKRLSCVR